MDTSLEELLHPPQPQPQPQPLSAPAAGSAATGSAAEAALSGQHAAETQQVAPTDAPPPPPPPPPLLPYETVLHVALQVAHAIDYLHPTIVHRCVRMKF